MGELVDWEMGEDSRARDDGVLEYLARGEEVNGLGLIRFRYSNPSDTIKPRRLL